MAQKSETVPVSAAALPFFKQAANNVKAQLQAAASVQSAQFE